MNKKYIIEELLNRFKSESYESLLAIATFSLNKILPIFEQIAESEEKAISVILTFITTSLSIDGRLSELEKKFVKQLLQLEDEQVENLYNYSSDQNGIYEFVDNVYDASPVEIQKQLLIFICCILSVDKNISYKEVDFIKKLIA